ncbi:MAG: phospholipase [Gemmatimonadales bacterium]
MDGALNGTVRDVWIACHGYGQLAAEFIGDLAALRSRDRVIVAPEGLSRFYFEGGFHGPDSKVGATWMTREDRLAEIEDYVAYLDALHDAVLAHVDRKAAKLTVLGFSQGTATVSRWIAAGRVQPDRVILWGGLLPPDLDLDAARGALTRAELVLVAGRRDRFVDDAKLSAQVAALERVGITTRTVRHPGGHRLNAEVLADLARGGTRDRAG